jgi:hypothetical protein
MTEWYTELLFFEDDDLAQYARIFVALTTLFVGYGLACTAASLGFPLDAAPRHDWAALANDVTVLGVFGVVIAFITGVHEPERFEWLASAPWFAFAFFGTCFFFGALDEVPGFQASLSTSASWPAQTWVVVVTALLAVAAGCGWLVRLAFRLGARTGCTYVASRTASLAVLGIQVACAQGGTFHLHHYYLGFLIALWGSMNTWVSDALLAVGCGLLAQGLAAYHAAPLFH